MTRPRMASRSVLGQLAPLDLLGQRPLQTGDGGVSRLLPAAAEHHLDPGPGGRLGDPCAHDPRSPRCPSRLMVMTAMLPAVASAFHPGVPWPCYADLLVADQRSRGTGRSSGVWSNGSASAASGPCPSPAPRGRVLDVGAGRRFNLAHYPAGVTEVIGVRARCRRCVPQLEEQATVAPVPVEVLAEDLDHLSFRRGIVRHGRVHVRAVHGHRRPSARRSSCAG